MSKPVGGINVAEAFIKREFREELKVKLAKHAWRISSFNESLLFIMQRLRSSPLLLFSTALLPLPQRIKDIGMITGDNMSHAYQAF